jgi:hypothetical protein
MNIIKYATNWKYRYFLKKLRGVESMIQDLLFKRFKTAEIREEVRQTYDQKKAKLLSVETTIKHEREKTDGRQNKMAEGDIARLEDEVIRLKQDIERHEMQLKGIDIDVNGSPRTNEFPEGHDGINQQLDGLRELSGMLKDYIKNL